MMLKTSIHTLRLNALLWGAVLATAAVGAETLPAPVAGTASPKTSATLKIGDPAPKLQNGRWIQGDPVKTFDRDHVYLVEFWATWCLPCKAAIPHVNDLHEKFKDRGLVIIGQNVWETAEPEVEPFVKKMGPAMAYRVALDDKSASAKGHMADSWLAAAGQKGIPASFLVNKQGVIVWIGHPMHLKESMIEAVLAGTFDAAQAVSAEKADAITTKALAQLKRDAYEAIARGDWAKADSIIAGLEKDLSENQLYQAGLLRLEAQLARGDQSGGVKLADKIAVENARNIFALQGLASQLLRVEAPEPATLDAAGRIASKANALFGGNDVTSLISLAHVAFLKGNQSQAVEYQAKVVELSKPASKPRMEAFLNSYKAGRLPDFGRPPRSGKERPAAARPPQAAPAGATGTSR